MEFTSKRIWMPNNREDGFQICSRHSDFLASQPRYFRRRYFCRIKLPAAFRAAIFRQPSQVVATRFAKTIGRRRSRIGNRFEPAHTISMIAVSEPISANILMPSITTFSCPACGQQFDWLAEHAGRQLVCICGGKIRIPSEKAPADGNEILANGLKQESNPANVEEPPPGKLNLDADGREIAPPPRVLEYRRATSADQSAFAQQRRTQFRDRWLPIGVLVLGLLTTVGMSLIFPRQSRLVTLGQTSLRLAWDISFTLISGLAINWMTDGALGEGNPVILKLIALAAGRFTVWTLIGLPANNILVDAACFFLSIPVFLMLFNWMFEEGTFQDAVLALLFMTAMRWVSYFGMWKLL